MSLSSFIADLYNSLSVSDVHAEAPPAEEKEPQPQEEEEEPKEEKEEAKEEPEKEEPEEEEEEAEEPEDPAPAILEGTLYPNLCFTRGWRGNLELWSLGECIKTKECKPFKHHYDECVERVTAAASDETATGPKEDCVEEFFHVLHCANACVAPKLFAKLK